MIPIEYATRKMGSIGMLLPNLEARIVDVEGNGDTDVLEGQPGELWIRGPTVMKVRFNGTLLSPVLITPRLT